MCKSSPRFLEFRVDDILAKIRKSVEFELDNLTAEQPKTGKGGLMRQTLHEMRRNMPAGDEPRFRPQDHILDLRSRIKRKVEAMEMSREAEPPAAAPPAPSVPARRDFAGILAGSSPPAPVLRPTFADDAYDADIRCSPPAAQWQIEEHQQICYEAQHQAYDDYAYAATEQAPLLSPQSEALTNQSFENLSNAILARAVGEGSLEHMTRDILHGLLKQWLDENLPQLVENIVREEIQRVARRSR